jgi:hypothetical protein
MKNIIVVLFVLMLEYLVILCTLIVCFIRSVYTGEIVIENKKNLIDWILSIIFWPITLIIGAVLENQRKEG